MMNVSTMMAKTGKFWTLQLLLMNNPRSIVKLVVVIHNRAAKGVLNRVNLFVLQTI